MYRSFLAVGRVGAGGRIGVGEEYGIGEKGNCSKRKDQDYSED